MDRFIGPRNHKEELLARVGSILRGAARLNKSEIEALEILGLDLKSTMPKGGHMKTQTVVKKRQAAAPAARRGWGGRGQSNFDAFGTVIEAATKVKALDDGIYIVKEGVCKLMAESNGTGHIAVVYRVPPKDKEAAEPTHEVVSKTKPAHKAPAAHEDEPTYEEVMSMDRSELLALKKDNDLHFPTKELEDKQLAAELAKRLGLEKPEEKEEELPTFDEIHEMSWKKLVKFAEEHDLDISAFEKGEEEECADAICEALDIEASDEE